MVAAFGGAAYRSLHIYPKYDWDPFILDFMQWSLPPQYLTALAERDADFESPLQTPDLSLANRSYGEGEALDLHPRVGCINQPRYIRGHIGSGTKRAVRA